MGRFRRRRRHERGFTMVEVLIVVSIIASLTAIAIPLYARVSEKGQRAVLASQAKVVLEAFKRYYVDHRSFPSETVFNPATLEPLTTDGYLSEHAARSFTSKLQQDKILFYAAIDWTAGDSDLLLVLRPRYADEWAYIFFTDLIPEAPDGVYFWYDGHLRDADGSVIW